MKTLSTEYLKLKGWRNWEHYLEKLPLSGNDTVLDLGCGSGFVTSLLAQKAAGVIGIEPNKDLISAAQTFNSKRNVTFINRELKDLDTTNIPMADGIWTSFSAAYFPDFKPILRKWLALLKNGGWIAIVEINDLFAHGPLQEQTQAAFNSYYEKQRLHNLYDFEMGGKLKHLLTEAGLSVILEDKVYDMELSFNGAATSEILSRWEDRLSRMVALQQFLGDDTFRAVKTDFLKCISSPEHTCNTEVKFIIARKPVA